MLLGWATFESHPEETTLTSKAEKDTEKMQAGLL